MATRPSTARKVTRTSETKRESELNRGLRITLEGDVFEVRIGDIPPHIAGELRSKVGCGPLRLINQCAIDPDIDLLSAFVWLARRMRGELVRFEDVEVTYADLLSEGFDIALPGQADEPDLSDPEA